MKRVFLAASLALAVLLSGCLVPERFSAKVEVQPDASYSFQYSGSAVNALAAAQLKQTGVLSEKDKVALKGETDKIAKNPDVRRVSYKGDGRYELEIVSKKKAGESLKMFDAFSVRTEKDGVMTIAAIEIKDKVKKDLEKMGLLIDGTLEVRVPKNAEVISHNATSSPSFFGMFGTYSWKVGRVDQRPVLKLKFKS